MTSLPLFSCIIPVFDRSHTILRALDSVLAQSLDDFEIIIVDDGSTDNLDETLKKRLKNPKIKYLKQANHGVSCARNLAAQNSRGKYLAFLDSDDEWLSHKLQAQKELFEYSDYRLVHGEEIWIRNGKRVNLKTKHQKGGGDQFLPSLELCLISPSATAIEKDFFWELGGFREDFPVCEDYDLWLKVTSLMDVGFIKEPICRKHGGAPDQLSFKYKGMDYWRCLSLLWVLKNRDLSSEKKAKAKEVAEQKLEIMLGGLRKKDLQDERIKTDIEKVEILKKEAALL